MDSKRSFALSVGRWMVYAESALFGAFFVYVIFPPAGVATARFFSDGVFSALLLLPAVICLMLGFTTDGSRRVWLAIGIGILFWWGGDLYAREVFGNSPNRPMPSIADGLHLMFYPSIFVGLFALLRRLSDVPRVLWLQGVVAALSVAALDAALVLESFSGQGGDAIGLATQLAYPMADLVLLMLVVGGRAVAGGQLGRAWNWLTGSLVLLALADSLYLYQTSTGFYHPGGLLDLCWPGAMLLIAAAALNDEGAVEKLKINRRLLTLPSVLFASSSMFLVVYDHFHAFGIQTLAPAVGALTLVIAEMALVQRDNLDLLERSLAEHFVDTVSGIPNRRALLRDLKYHCATATEQAPVSLILHDLRGFKAYNDKFGHVAGDALLARLGQNLQRVAVGFGGAYRDSGDEYCVIASTPDSQAEGIARITREALYERGEGFEIAALTGIVSIPREARDPMAILKLADQRVSAEKVRHTTISPDESAAMIRLMRSRSIAAGRYTRLIEESLKLAGTLMGLHTDEIENVIQGFQLRDIGNCAIPDEILNKNGELTESEWRVVRSHTVVGERIVKATPSLRTVAEIVRHHHERFDGNGYPDGLAAGAIPVGARLVAVAQAFEGMTADRPSRPAKSFREAVAELGRQAGTEFDPRALAAFCQALDSTAGAFHAEIGAASPASPEADAGPDWPPERSAAQAGGQVVDVPLGVIGAYAPSPRRRLP
ncbi:MAG: diguanylate cyclase [Thermoleophilia bacterium]|nr:diguanylate cyclase [Thermoleophilia bacterium]